MDLLELTLRSSLRLFQSFHTVKRFIIDALSTRLKSYAELY